MKNNFGMILFLAATALLTAGAAAANLQSAGVKTMKHVDADMLLADYWSGKEAGSGKILMTEEEIVRFNQEMLETLPELLYDLEALPETVGGAELAGMIGWQVPEETYYVRGPGSGSGLLEES